MNFLPRPGAGREAGRRRARAAASPPARTSTTAPRAARRDPPAVPLALTTQDAAALRGEILAIERLGTEGYQSIWTPRPVRLTARFEGGGAGLQVGARAAVRAAPDSLHLFDAATELALALPARAPAPVET